MSNKSKESPPNGEDKYQEIINRSGNTFHCKVSNFFRDQGWSVMISPYYIDTATDKAREIDLLCEKVWQSVPSPWAKPIGFRVQLFIECKYVDRDTVFWFDRRDDARISREINRQIPVFKDNAYADKHHYNTAALIGLGKLFASGKGQGGGGEDREPIYLALNQVLGGLSQLRGIGTLTPIPSGYRQITVKYPVIVCSTFERFRRTEIVGASDPQTIADNFLLEVDYAYSLAVPERGDTTIRQYSLIDVVAYDLLSQFIQRLEREGQAVASLA